MKITEETIKYNAENWQEVELIIEPSGKSPKHYGEGVYRFSASLTMPIMMPRRGWTVVKASRNYVHMKPPAGQEKPPFIIKAKIPTIEQAIEIANDLFAQGKNYNGQIGEWPVLYIHEYVLESYKLSRGEDGKGIKQELAHVFPATYDLYMGENGIWQLTANKTDGNFKVRVSAIIKGQNALLEDLFANNVTAEPSNPIEDLFEGQELSVELTKYERNAEARKKCIAHYGAICHVCEMDFGKTWGVLGLGFIHVHHIVPISQQGGEYKTDPVNDLIPLCPNCHAMAHRRNPPLSIAELKKIHKK